MAGERFVIVAGLGEVLNVEKWEGMDLDQGGGSKSYVGTQER